MGETKSADSTEKARDAKDTKNASGTRKKGFFSNVKSEFGKIIWPDRNTVAKQSFAVIVITAILSAFIALLDMGIIEVVDKVLK